MKFTIDKSLPTKEVVARLMDGETELGSEKIQVLDREGFHPVRDLRISIRRKGEPTALVANGAPIPVRPGYKLMPNDVFSIEFHAQVFELTCTAID